MLMPIGVKVFLATKPIDLRASFYRLAAYVRATHGGNPQDGHLYVFVGRGKNLVKILFWDRSGYCVFANHQDSYCTSSGCSDDLWESCIFRHFLAARSTRVSQRLQCLPGRSAPGSS